jgi:hypothetical protein
MRLLRRSGLEKEHDGRLSATVNALSYAFTLLPSQPACKCLILLPLLVISLRSGQKSFEAVDQDVYPEVLLTRQDSNPRPLEPPGWNKPMDIHQCSPHMLHVIRRQLPPDLCQTNVRRPWNNLCSFSFATRCPQNSYWVEEHYQMLRRGLDSVTSFRESDESTFTAI